MDHGDANERQRSAKDLEVAGAGPVHIQGENGSGAVGSDPY